MATPWKVFKISDFGFPYQADTAAKAWVNSQKTACGAIVFGNDDSATFHYSPECVSDPDLVLPYLINLLNRHDWTYHYSDDHRYWMAGQKSWDEIQRVVAEAEKLGLGNTARGLVEVNGRLQQTPFNKDQLEKIFSKD